MMLLDRKMTREFEELVRDPVILVVNQLVIAPAVDGADDGRGTDEVERDPADNLDQGMRALEKDTRNEDLVDTLFLHASAHNACALEK
jgi:hypothetical protein